VNMNILRRAFLGLSAALLLTATSIPLSAADAPVLERIIEKGEIRIGMSGDQPPLNAKNRSGLLFGFEVDVAEVIADAMGVKLTLVQKPFPQLLPALKAGEVDIVMSGVTITAERSVEVKFVGPYMYSGKSILTKSNVLARAEAPDDINASTVKLVALANSTSQEFAELNLPEAPLTTTEDYASAVKLLLDDKVDAMVADMPICFLSVLRHPGQGLATLTAPLNIEPIGVAVPANDPQLESLIENYLNALEGTSILDRLQEKWFEDASWVASLP